MLDFRHVHSRSTNGGSTRQDESVADEGELWYEKLIPDELPEAYKVKIAVAMEIPREAHLIYSVDDGALRTGLKFTFEELAPDRTRVAFTIDELTGDGAKGLEVNRSEEHTSELQSLMRISYAVFCLNKNTKKNETSHNLTHK